MPNQDGFDFIQELNQLSKELVEDIKVVFVSSSNASDDIEKAKSFDKVISYIVKPISFQHLDDLDELLNPTPTE